MKKFEQLVNFFTKRTPNKYSELNWLAENPPHLVLSEESQIRLVEAKKLAEYLGAEIKTIEAIVCFGSTANGRAEKNSDIDLLFITSFEMNSMEEYIKYRNNIRKIITTPKYGWKEKGIQIDLGCVGIKEFLEITEMDLHFDLIDDVKRTGVVVYIKNQSL